MRIASHLVTRFLFDNVSLFYFQFDRDADPWEGARCNRIIMFLTDGGTEMPEEVFKKYNWPDKRVSKDV